MNKNDAKKEITILTQKYDKIINAKIVNKYNEEMTKKDFIQPLFRALNWDIENSDEVLVEETISKKRVDYSFRINGIPKFFLEAKSLKGDLDNPQFISQAIEYSYNKMCNWAVLTNFDSIKIFNSEWKSTNPLQSNLKTINYNEFITRFDELWLLSKDSFEQGLLDLEAEKWGKKSKRNRIDKQLLDDFTHFREILSKSITKFNQKKQLSQEELDESVQKILNRLIFIRNCEDREIEEKILMFNLSSV
jgi:predicted type IV restriction endonuclease